ncbi:hypothetical protein [Hoeflea olei]|nr:hypothetical protein [Hoeflea olei]
MKSAAGSSRSGVFFSTGRIDAAIGTIAESLGLRVMQVPGLFTLIMPG